MKAMRLAKYTLQLLIAGMLLVAFLPVMPASAETNTLGISITENMNRADVYTPNNPATGGVTTTGTLTGSGVVTITNNLATTDLYDITLVLNKGSTSGWAVSSGTATLMDNTPAAGQVTVHIPLIAATQNVQLSYTVSSTATLPVQLTATYDSNKVNVGGSTTVHLTATKDSSVLSSDISSITVTVTPKDLDTDAVNDWTFSAPSAGAVNAAGSIVWSPAALTTAAPAATLDFTTTEADANAHTDAALDVQIYDMATTSIAYASTSTSNTAAGVSVSGSPRAKTTGMSSDLSKAFVSGNTWQFTPRVTNTNAEDVTFTLNTVTFWASLNSNLNTASFGPTTTTVNGDLIPGASWTGTPTSVDIGGTPVGFIKSDFTVKDTATQMPRSYVSCNGASGVTLLKKIWVLNGYNIEVTKAIQSLGGGSFRITITVTNIGTKTSPPNVLVYDIVPTTFISAGSPSNFNPAATGSTAVNVAGTTGNAYWWNVGALAPSASTTITYDVAGTGDYPLSDVFIIGVDPAQSVSIQSTPILSNAATMVNANFETLAALGAAGLLAVGMVGTARRRL